MEGHCLTGQSPFQAVLPMEEEEYNAKTVVYVLVLKSCRYESIKIINSNAPYPNICGDGLPSPQ